jgi:hypothetical protein
MATPYVTGVAGLVSEAMEFDAPESIRFPSPAELHADGVTAEERLEATLRLKSVILSTASQTAFTAAPFHHPTHRPDYRHGERDPFEGYGRVNPDAAVDAVSQELLDTSGVSPTDSVGQTISTEVGLNVPEDSRAFAGYVELPNGTLDASLSFTHYSGGNKGMALENPHLDLFVYDAENPTTNGEPNSLASAMGVQGDASVTLDASTVDTSTVYVVAKLVNVPGAVNTNDVQANFDLDLTYTAAPLPAFTVTGSRSDDGSVFTQGSTNQVTVTVDSIPDGVSEVAVTDAVPEGWTVEGFGDARTSGDVRTVELGTVSRSDLSDGPVTRTYFVEATGGSGQYTFGPAEAAIVGDSSAFRDDTATFGGTDDNTIVGADQNQSSL